MKPYPLKLITLLLLLFILQSCVDKPGIWKNEKIAGGKRSDFHALTTDALYWLKANKFKRMKFIMSKELNQNSYTERSIEHISNYLNDNKYSIPAQPQSIMESPNQQMVSKESAFNVFLFIILLHQRSNKINYQLK
jgi:hypothetical protein